MILTGHEIYETFSDLHYIEEIEAEFVNKYENDFTLYNVLKVKAVNEVGHYNGSGHLWASDIDGLQVINPWVINKDEKPYTHRVCNMEDDLCYGYVVIKNDVTGKPKYNFEDSTCDTIAHVSHYDKDVEECTNDHCIKLDGDKDCADNEYCGETSCNFCRNEDFTNDELLEYALKLLNISRNNLVLRYKAIKKEGG
jgi:hypothetical protein